MSIREDVLRYVSEHPYCTKQEIADALGIDLKQVTYAVNLNMKYRSIESRNDPKTYPVRKLVATGIVPDFSNIRSQKRKRVSPNAETVYAYIQKVKETTATEASDATGLCMSVVRLALGRLTSEGRITRDASHFCAVKGQEIKWRLKE